MAAATPCSVTPHPQSPSLSFSKNQYPSMAVIYGGELPHRVSTIPMKSTALYLKTLG